MIQAVIKGTVLEESIFIRSIGDHVFRYTLGVRDPLIAWRSNKGKDMSYCHSAGEEGSTAWGLASHRTGQQGVNERQQCSASKPCPGEHQFQCVFVSSWLALPFVPVQSCAFASEVQVPEHGSLSWDPFIAHPKGHENCLVWPTITCFCNWPLTHMHMFILLQSSSSCLWGHGEMTFSLTWCKMR